MTPSAQHAAKPPASPTVADFHARLDKILPLVEAKVDEAEALGYLTDDVVAAMRKAGLYTMLFPKAVGGAELLPYDAMTVTERLSYAHASAGWCVMAGNVEGTVMASYLEEEGIRKVFANGPDITVAGAGFPRGFARPVESGYMISGRWAYGSGIQHADWVESGCFLMDPSGKEMMKEPDGTPKVVITHHPRSAVKLLANWDVLGLRATGSFDYAVADADELFVPSYMIYQGTKPRRGPVQGELGLHGFVAWAHSAWALGVGRRMLDELKKVILQRKDRFGRGQDSASFKFQFAQAEARFRAASAFVRETWKDVSATCQRGESPSFHQMTLIKLSLRHIHDAISDVGTFAHRAARGASLHNTLMQLFYRDIHSGTQHILMADQLVEECGRVLLGLTGPNARWATSFNITE